MQCEERTSALNLFLDSALEPADQTDLFSHLAVCEECRSYISTMMKIGNVRQNENISYPAEIDDRIMRHLSISQDSSFNRKRPADNVVSFRKHMFQIPAPVVYALIAASIVLSFFVGRFSFLQKETPQTMQVVNNAQQPSAVIYVYGLPPVEVIGKTTKAVYHQNNQIEN